MENVFGELQNCIILCISNDGGRTILCISNDGGRIILCVSNDGGRIQVETLKA